jgi:hypothetical protein
MSTSKFAAQLSAIVCGLGLVASVSAAPHKGPADAVAVCQAIMQDDAQKVSRLLTQYRAPVDYSIASLVPGSVSLKTSRNVYQCNGMALDEFAAAVGAEQTSALFAGARATGEDNMAEAQGSGSDSQI